MMRSDLSHWSLEELIDHVLQEGLVDECHHLEDHLVIVQGCTRFVLDPERARAFLRGVIKGMSPAHRWRSWLREQDHPAGESPERDSLILSFRQHLVRKWWDRYAQAGCPLGDGVDGLMLWIRHETATTVN